MKKTNRLSNKNTKVFLRQLLIVPILLLCFIFLFYLILNCINVQFLQKEIGECNALAEQIGWNDSLTHYCKENYAIINQTFDNAYVGKLLLFASNNLIFKLLFAFLVLILFSLSAGSLIFIICRDLNFIKNKMIKIIKKKYFVRH